MCYYYIPSNWIGEMTQKEAITDKTTKTFLHILKKHLDSANIQEAKTISDQLQISITANNPFYIKYSILNLRLYLLSGKFQYVLDKAKHLESHSSLDKFAKIYQYKAQAKENLNYSLEEVLDEYLNAASFAEKSKDLDTLANCLSSAGNSCIALGKKNMAISLLNKALKHSNNLTMSARAKLHGNMGILMQRTGSLSDAVYHYTKTIEISKLCGNTQIEANALSYLGHVQIDMGAKEQGIQNYEKALSIHKNNGNKRGECITLGNLGGVQVRYDATEKAISNLKTAILIAEEIGHTKGLITFRANLGLAYKLNGQFDTAYEHLQKSMELLEITQDKRALAICHLNLAGVLAATHKIHSAIDEARLSLRLACATNTLITQARALCTLGWLMQKSDRLDMALNFFRESDKRFQAAEDHPDRISSIIGESSTLLDKGDNISAMEKYREAIILSHQYCTDIESKKDLSKLEKRLGKKSE